MSDGTTATVPNVTDPNPVVDKPVEFGSVVPAEYKDKPYMKDVTSFDALFKQHDNLQVMIGKRPNNIPQETDAQEKWDEFYKNCGRPDKADEYEFDNAPEGLKRNEDIFNKTRDLFHQAGLTKKQAKTLQAGYEKMISDQMGQAQKAFDDEFDKLAKSHFGDNQDKALENTSKLLKELCPKDYADHVAGLDNKTLLVVSAVLDAVHKKYINEDGITSTKEATAVSKVNLRDEGRKLMASEAWQNKFHPEHESTRARVTEIYQSLSS